LISGVASAPVFNANLKNGVSFNGINADNILLAIAVTPLLAIDE
jgi:hypothetical protein